ncbi:MAG: hypothetical protein EBZ50_13045 [Alphaproteobacteria bacterium]|nr:hypothetical protein [Alphaproteobacteria bacterium]
MWRAMTIPKTIDQSLRGELVVRARRARDLHAKLLNAGKLGPGYHPEQEALDAANADWLASTLAARGWPKRSEVGDDGAAAAVQLLQRAMGRPAVQRQGLELLMQAAEQGEASMIDAGHFADRIAVYEGKPQLFGTQLDWGPDGLLAPALMDDAETVDQRRRTIGLPPLADLMADAREAAVGGPPPDLAERRAAFEAWAKKVGWR